MFVPSRLLQAVEAVELVLVIVTVTAAEVLPA